MSLRSDLNGTFDTAALKRLTWPVAWNGTVAASEQREQEAELHSFVNEAEEAIREAILADGYAVEVKDGEIVSVLCGQSDE